MFKCTLFTLSHVLVLLNSVLVLYGLPESLCVCVSMHFYLGSRMFVCVESLKILGLRVHRTYVAARLALRLRVCSPRVRVLFKCQDYQWMFALSPLRQPVRASAAAAYASPTSKAFPSHLFAFVSISCAYTAEFSGIERHLIYTARAPRISL